MVVDTPQNQFLLGGQWELRKYLTVADDGSSDVDRAVRISALDRFNDFNVSASVDSFKHEVVGLRLYEQATLRNNEADSGVTGDPFTTQLRNALGGGLRISPGQALEVVPGASWSFDEYRLPVSAGLSRTRFNSRNTYGPNLKVKWDFFPRTSLVSDFSLEFNRWAENEVTSDAIDPLFGDSITLPDSTHLKFNTGLQGRFTERVFLDLLAGYGTAIYDETTVVEDLAQAGTDLTGGRGILATVQLRYKMTDETQASIGYKRSFSDAFFTSFVAYDHLYAQLSASVADVRPTLRYSMRMEQYDGQVIRSDVLSRLDAGVAYDVQRWAALSAGVFWQQRAVAEQLYDDAEYDDFTFSFTTRFIY
jgi:hypothetical protein